MQDFQYYTPTKVFFGKHAEAQVGAVLRARGCQKVLLHYGGGSVKASGLLDRIIASLQEAGIRYVELGGVAPNPKLEEVRHGVQVCREQEADFILAIGGGSVIDTAKFIGVDALFDGDLWEYCYMQGNLAPKSLPVATVLTIAATGSEGSDSSIITRNHLKKNMGGDIIRPVFSIMDPELTMTLPRYQTASGIVDMIAHVHERYFSNSPDNDLTDYLCEAIFKAILQNAPRVMKQPDDYEARAALMWAGTLAHNGICGCGRTMDLAVHFIQHPISAHFGSAHGAGCGVITLGWIKYVYKHDMARFVRYFTRVWNVENDELHPERVILEGIEKQKNFYLSLGMPTTLGEIGASEADIPMLAQECDVFPHGKTGNFVQLDRKDVENIYRLCL